MKAIIIQMLNINSSYNIYIHYNFFALSPFYIKEMSHVWVGLVYGDQCNFQQYFSYIVVVSFFLVEETRVPGENHRPTASN
jgi:hypothetical protein